MTRDASSACHDAAGIAVGGPLRVPVDPTLRRTVRALLRSGVPRIRVDLARVVRIDAAGVGELVRAYNMTMAAAAALHLVHVNPWVREMLERVGLFELLSAAAAVD
jgi:anti-anti-sigma factor